MGRPKKSDTSVKQGPKYTIGDRKTDFMIVGITDASYYRLISNRENGPDLRSWDQRFPNWDTEGKVVYTIMREVPVKHLTFEEFRAGCIAQLEKYKTDKNAHLFTFTEEAVAQAYNQLAPVKSCVVPEDEIN